MKNNYIDTKRCFRLVLSLAILAFSLNASAQEKGLVSGVVKDESTGKALPGATVRIKGTYTGASTKIDGSFDLFVDPGTIELEISFIGNETKVETVVVEAGDTKYVEISLGPDVQQLDEVTVTATLEGQMRALNQQKSADNLKNIVSADQIGKFPDQNAAESLQRVPGVNIQRDEGDGRFVLVRGLAPQFTNISVNGEQIPSPEAGARFVALDAIPANQLASLEVTKAITPDMDGDAIGGSVNLITPTAESEDLKVSGSGSAEYNHGIEKVSGQGSLSLSQRLGGGKFGYILSGSYAASRKGSDRYELDGWGGDHPDGLDEFIIGDYEIDRNRIGLSGTFDLKLSDNSKIYLRTLYSELRELEQRRETQNKAEEDEDVLEYETVKELKHRQENQGVYSFNLGGNYNSAKLKLDYEVSYSKAYQDTPFNDKIVYANDEDVSWGVDLGDVLNPKLVNYTYNGNPSAFGVSENYVYDQNEISATIAEDENVTAKFNLTFPFDLGDNSSEIKIGAKTRFKDKTYRYEKFEEYELTDGADDLTLVDFQSEYTDDNFMAGDLGETIGYFPDHGRFTQYQRDNIGDFDLDETVIEEEAALEAYNATEDVYAAYGQGKIQLDKLMVLAGLRYELNKVEYQNSIWDADEGIAISQTVSNDYSFLLPMVHFKYEIDNNTNLRAAVTRSYARPNFEDLVQGAEIAAEDEEASISNPNLKPVQSINFDLFGEKYFGTVGLLSGGVFYKDMNDFIYQQTVLGDILDYTDFEITQSINGQDAWLFGFEVAWQQNLTFLPGALKGIGVYMNYTFTESSATVENFAQGNELNEIDLPGQSKHVGNVALSYAIGGFNARASLNFNGRFISEIDGGDLVYIENRKQLDISVSQSFLEKKLTAFIQLNNITDENQIEIYNTSATPKQREQYGFWARAGLKFNL